MMKSVKRFLVNYHERHLNGTNQALHVVGVPMTFVVSLVFLFQGSGWIALMCFVTGYVLQFLGHAIEGNDAGEMILIKRGMGVPFIEFGPKHPSRSIPLSTPPSTHSPSTHSPVGGPHSPVTRQNQPVE